MRPMVLASPDPWRWPPRRAGRRGAPPRAPFEEAGRLVDELAARLGSFGAELVQQIQQGAARTGSRADDGAPGGAARDRPIITIMLHHRTELGLSPEQVSAAGDHPRRVRAGGDPPGRGHPRRRARPGRAARPGAGGLRQGGGQGPGGGAAPGRPPDRAAPRGRAGEGGAHRRAADAPAADAERRDAPRVRGLAARGMPGRRGARPRHRRPPLGGPAGRERRMTISKVGVVGCGLMGGGIAQVVAQSGYATTVVEADQGLLDRGLHGHPAEPRWTGREGADRCRAARCRAGALDGDRACRGPGRRGPRHRGDHREPGDQEGDVRPSGPRVRSARHPGVEHLVVHDHGAGRRDEASRAGARAPLLQSRPP